MTLKYAVKRMLYSSYGMVSVCCLGQARTVPKSVPGSIPQ